MNVCQNTISEMSNLNTFQRRRYKRVIERVTLALTFIPAQLLSQVTLSYE